MLSLIFDTETTGVPKNYRALITDNNNWPYIVQLAWILIDSENNKIIERKNYIISLPPNIIIPEESIKVHGITNKIMRERGIKAQIAFNEFLNALNKTDILVAHNINFDVSVLRAELFRNKFFAGLNLLENRKHKQIHFCTMKYGIPICNLTKINERTGKIVPKWPKLVELHWALFNQDLQEDKLHDALADVMVCLRCYWKMHYGEDLINSCKDFALKYQYLKD